MRAGYATVALAIVGAVVLGPALVATGDPPMTVRAALGFDGPELPGIDARRAAAVARLTTACMDRLGLRHTADPDPVPVIPDADLDPVAWAERWGFGVSTGRPATEVTAGPSRPRSAEALAALYGDAGFPGCHGAATEAVYGLRDRLLAPVRAALDSLDAEIEADAAMAPVRDAWAACVEPFADELDVPPARRTREALPARLLERFAELAAASREDSQLGGAIAALERRVAASIARCEMAFAAGRAAVAAPHEARFVAAHRGTLARIGRAIRIGESRLAGRPR